MNLKERISVFDKELSLFSSATIRDFAIFCLNKVPDYFFSVPASQSGKHHPSYALGEGGLVRHTKAAMAIANSLAIANVTVYFSTDLCMEPTQISDACLLALLFHDSFKLGSDRNAHTVHEHPLIAAHFLRNQIAPFMEEHDVDALYDISVMQTASAAISSHMGQYTKSSHSRVILPSPMAGDWCAKLVHICDLLASRKYLEYKPGTGVAGDE